MSVGAAGFPAVALRPLPLLLSGGAAVDSGGARAGARAGRGAAGLTWERERGEERAARGKVNGRQRSGPPLQDVTPAACHPQGVRCVALAAAEGGGGRGCGACGWDWNSAAAAGGAGVGRPRGHPHRRRGGMGNAKWPRKSVMQTNANAVEGRAWPESDARSPT